MSVYDDENKDLESLSPQEIQDLEQGYSTPQDEAEDNAVESGANPENLENRAMGRKLRQRGQNMEAAESKKLENKIGDSFDAAKKADGDLYNPTGNLKKFNAMLSTDPRKRAGLFIGLGGGLIAILIAVGSFMGLLSTFKLDHLLQNIEQRSFVRYQVSMEGRSTKWIQAYMQLRMAEIEDPNGVSTSGREQDNLLFRANRVDTNSPTTDWYQTMRTSKFEQDLAEKQGIKFTSVAVRQPNGTIKMRPGVITINDKPITFDLTPDEIKSIENVDVNKLNGRLKTFVDVTVMTNDKEARIAIKKAVNENTKSWQVIKRRHIRKNIQNMTGVRDWRFFEKTRDKIDEKQIDIRNKIIIKALPESTKSGKFIQCLFGITECRSSSDPLNAENRTTTATSTGENKSNGRDETNPDPNAPAVGDDALQAAEEGLTGSVGDELAKESIKAAIIKQLLSKINAVTGVASIIDTLSRIDESINSGAIVKMVTVAKGTQAMGLYTTLNIARDQMRTGEVTTKEVSQFMRVFNNASNSEGWTTVIAPSANAVKAEGFTAAKDKTEYCSELHQAEMRKPENQAAANKEFGYMCDSLKIGGEDNKANTITSWWQNGIGKILQPLLAPYRASGFGAAFEFVNNIIGAVTGPIVDGILKATGLGTKVEEFVAWAAGEVASQLGAGPMLDNTMPDSAFFNVATEGGAYTAEVSARYQGASKTNIVTENYTRSAVAANQGEKASTSSNYDKYISLSNPDSAASKTLFGATEKGTTTSTLVTSAIAEVKNIPLSLFAGKTNAQAAQDPYAAAKFGAIETFDFPQQCIDLDPLTMKPEQATNGAGYFAPGELTWELLRNNTAFNDALYEKVSKASGDKADDIIKTIYNCASMDAAVQGGLGYLYGYKNDNGLDDAAAAGTQNIATNPNVYIVGDSLTEGMLNLGGNLKEKLTAKGWVPTADGAVSRRIADGTSPNSGLDQLQKDKTAVTQAGTIVVELGTNNYGADDASFTRDLQKVYDYIRSVNPNATIYWMNYGASKETQDSKLAQKTILLATFAQKNNIKIIDWAAISDKYTIADSSLGIHPNATGYGVMADLVATALGSPPQASGLGGAGGSKLFTTNTAVKFPGVEEALTRAQRFADPNHMYDCPESDSTRCYRRCDHLAGEVWGYRASGYATAYVHWASMNARGKGHPNDRNVPVGAIMFWRSDPSDDVGHAAVYLGDGKIISNDVNDPSKGYGGVYIVSADDIEKKWGMDYLGWADPIYTTPKSKIVW